MMTFTIDLISDLHLHTWPTQPLENQATSHHCLVVGDVTKDRNLLYQHLTHLGRCYQAVFYIDGNDEHRESLDNLGNSYKTLTKGLAKIPNLVYLQDNVVVIDGVAIVGTNGWWNFDFDISLDPEQSALWYKEKENIGDLEIQNIKQAANIDATYMTSSIRRLQRHRDVKKIIVATHTVPNPDLISHDVDLNGKLKFNTMGNRYLQHSLVVDTENKIHTWCFGHYHNSVDQYKDGVRYVNNCRGRGDSKYSTYAYHPKRIIVEY